MGTFVNTLSLDLGVTNVTWHDLELAAHVRASAMEPPQCCLLGNDMVFCKGFVEGRCLEDRYLPFANDVAWIIRLPEGHRPQRTLIFAASCVGLDVERQTFLVVVVVNPDGVIMAIGRHKGDNSVDLSCIRFNTSRGVEIADDVKLHSCDVGMVRLVALQGNLSERIFAIDRLKRIALLPPGFRPLRKLTFVVAGMRTGGFHLVRVEEDGELHWIDSVWAHDSLNVSGMIFVAAQPAANELSSLGGWTSQRRDIVVRDFQKSLVRRFGSIENAWETVFDLDGSGAINFMEFEHGCKQLGRSHDATRLWHMFDEDHSGEITMDELAEKPPDPYERFDAARKKGGDV